MTKIIFTSISGSAPLNIYVADAFGGNETYLGQITVIPIVGDVVFDLPEIFHSTPQVTIIVEDIDNCRTTKKTNCYVNCDIIYSITDITSTTPIPTPTPSATSGYFPTPTTNRTLQINNIIGTAPFELYISDVNGNYGTFVGLVVSNDSLPVSVDVPSKFEGSDKIILTVKDSKSCSFFKIIDCVITPSMTPTNSITPTPTPTIGTTPTQTPTNSITPTQTPTNSITPTQTPTNSITPTLTNSVTPTPTNSITPTLTNSNTPTLTPTNSITPTPTNSTTPTLTPTNSITPTLTNSVTPTLTPTLTQFRFLLLENGSILTTEGGQYIEITFTQNVTPTITASPTSTPSPTITSSPTLTPTPTEASYLLFDDNTILITEDGDNLEINFL